MRIYAAVCLDSIVRHTGQALWPITMRTAGWTLLPHCVLSQCCVLSILPAEHIGSESTDLFFFLAGTQCTGKYKKAKREQSCFVPFNLRFGGLWSPKHTLEISKSWTISSFVVLKDLQQPSSFAGKYRRVPMVQLGETNVESLRKVRYSPLGMACRALPGATGWQITWCLLGSLFLLNEVYIEG